MASSSSLSVRIEQPGQAFGEVMNEIRSWLDSHKVQPVAFRSDNASGNVAFDIRFAREQEARLFEQAFSGGAHGSPTTRGNAAQDAPPSGQSALTVDDLIITQELEIRAKRRQSYNRATASALQRLTGDITEHPSEVPSLLVAFYSTKL